MLHQMWITCQFIKPLYKSFPQIIKEKRYKLINFARIMQFVWISDVSA